MENISLIITILAVITMLYALWQVFALKEHIQGGMVGRRWRILAALVVLFALGYIAMPFMGQLPVNTLHSVVAVIFLFGAIYVVVTISLIKRIILALSE
ncbi:hypothetical protein [Thiohalophilus thiocyanatoxydans]|uniref:Uncharacterized protein n=1 Tax=Thiohalophilus thiocyanatoxydans TaxID=381308 RepID=A0A4R8IKE1_9GAMM|nr:hypothetical protein [Thiohalophilus thiocyanatoxydans]TDY00554.1 hypothetical protein EDC23_2057 [Thiohalophilus thiocyanatoxydans]